MRVTVFGATGGTGKHVVDRCLAAGHKVTAVARDPQAVPGERDGLTVLRGDVFDKESVAAAIAGSDAVVSVLGVADRKQPTTVYSAGVANMLAAMAESGPRRIVALSADGVEPNPNVNIGQRLVMALVVAKLFKHQYKDMLAMERVLADSGLDWTAVRPPRLSDGEHTGSYRTGAEPLKDSSTISRADLADYLVTQLEDEDSYQKVVWVST
ncbi:MAG TPA: SDR family oxidoreductase [Actinophytocola sp.]|jgi:putative NADH-flavin reductase|uniref:NAD(P)-dependent oxidoreductase n=1 Tax=Actinophytocola sp. TaxID=1872138 RepID=UPI002F937553